MQNIFNEADCAAIERRLLTLTPTSSRQWGHLTVAQKLAHCAITLETLGERDRKSVV